MARGRGGNTDQGFVASSWSVVTGGSGDRRGVGSGRPAEHHLAKVSSTSSTKVPMTLLLFDVGALVSYFQGSGLR